MSIRVVFDKINNIPIKPDAINYGSIAASGIDTHLKVGDNVIVSGNYNFDTVTVTLSGISEPLFEHPRTEPGKQTFAYRNRTWSLLSVDEGATITIGTTKCYLAYTFTGADFNTPNITVS